MDRSLALLRREWRASRGRMPAMRYIRALRRAGRDDEYILEEVGIGILHTLLADFDFHNAVSIMGRGLAQRVHAMGEERRRAQVVDEVENLIENREATFERFTLQLPAVAVDECSGQGDATEAVQRWASRPIFSHISDADLRAELSEYGSWEDDDLQDRETNEQRILWIAANNIHEEDQQPFGGPLIDSIVQALRPLHERGEIDYYRGYSRGYEEEQTSVFVSDWNVESVYDHDSQERIVGDAMSRLGEMLEGLPNVETDWTDQVASCSHCYRAVETGDAAAGDEHFVYISGDLVCYNCLPEFASEFLEQLVGSHERLLPRHGIDPRDHDYAFVSSAEQVSRHIFDIPEEVFSRVEVEEPQILQFRPPGGGSFDDYAYMLDSDLEDWITASMDAYEAPEEVPLLSKEERELIESGSYVSRPRKKNWSGSGSGSGRLSSSYEPDVYLNYLLDNREAIANWPNNILEIAGILSEQNKKMRGDAT